MDIRLVSVLVMILAYLLGDISPSMILASFSGVDIRNSGSGNAGATNALRVLGKKAGIITVFIDIFKGYIAVVIATFFLPLDIALVSGLFVLLGHVYPVFYGFKGGKGVATSFGVLLAVDYKMALICLGIVVLVVLITRMVSLGSITACIAFLILAFWMDPEFLKVGVFMAAIVLYKHKSNVSRILIGKENKIGTKKKKV